MSKIVKETQLELKKRIVNAVEKAMENGELPKAEIPEFIIEVPSNRENGDFSSNIAMAGARAFKNAPRKIAEAIQNNLELENTYFEKCEIAGPGFMNFYLGQSYYSAVVEDVLEKGEDYGKSDYGNGKRVLVEFVSANPTGDRKSVV